MTYVLPPDLYKDWKELYFTSELLKEMVKELKGDFMKRSEDTIVNTGDYTVVQSATNNHIHIFANGRRVMHFSCNTKESEEDLKRYVGFYEDLKADSISEDIRRVRGECDG